MNDLMDASIAPRPILGGNWLECSPAVAEWLFVLYWHLWIAWAYMVGQRSSVRLEIRVALGAQRPDILKLILGKGAIARPVLGIAIGLIRFCHRSTG